MNERSRITPTYLCDITSSKGVKLWVGGLTSSTSLASVMVLSPISMRNGGKEGVNIAILEWEVLGLGFD